MEGKKWYQKISNWIFMLAVLILLPILITNISIMFQANSAKDKVPNVFGYKPFIVLSGSMETEIRVGDLIITKEQDPKTLKKDDVIAFRDSENTVTTHRIIDIVEKDGTKYFVTKGDNNVSQDENLVEYKDVEGIYVTRIPGFGNIFNELSKPTTIIILVIGVTLIFMLLFQISNKKLKEQERQEFLEYKKMMEEKKKTSKEKESSKKTSTKTKETVKKSPTKTKEVNKKTSTKTKETTKKATTAKSSKTPKKTDVKKEPKKAQKKTSK